MAIQIKFTVTNEAVAYLRWLAKNVLFEDSPNDAARHLMMKELERTRRKHRKDEPTTDDLKPLSIPEAEKGAKD